MEVKKNRFADLFSTAVGVSPLYNQVGITTEKYRKMSKNTAKHQKTLNKRWIFVCMLCVKDFKTKTNGMERERERETASRKLKPTKFTLPQLTFSWQLQCCWLLYI